MGGSDLYNPLRLSTPPPSAWSLAQGEFSQTGAGTTLGGHVARRSLGEPATSVARFAYKNGDTAVKQAEGPLTGGGASSVKEEGGQQTEG